MTDTDALQRYARRRDPAAFAHLIESYQQMVYAVCLRRLGHEADARDATQDTFVKLARSAGDIRAADGSVVGWLHRCATTTSIDLMRSESRRRGRERAVAVAERVDASDLPWHDVRSSLDEALGELPDAQRDLIVQRYLVGRTQAHLAAEADISPSMMSRRVHAALDALRERLRRKGFGIGLAALTSGLGAEAAVALPANLSAALTTTATTAAATTATAPASAALPASSSAALPSASGGFTSASASASASASGGGGWLWLGTKIKLSTAILGSLGIHAALVGVVLWLGPGLSTLVTPPAPSAAPQPAGSGPSQPVSPRTAPPPRSADAPRVIRVADAEAVEPPELPAAIDTENQEAPAEFVYLMGSIARPGAYAVPADADLTLKQLIASAGGTNAIDERLVRLIRRAEGEAQEQTVVEAPLREVIETAIGDTPVQPDDLVVLGDAAADVRAGIESSWTPMPFIIDPRFTGKWVLRAEDRQGRDVGSLDGVAVGSILNFAGDRLTTVMPPPFGMRLEMRAVNQAEPGGLLDWRMVLEDVALPDADDPAQAEAIRNSMADETPWEMNEAVFADGRVYLETPEAVDGVDGATQYAPPGEFTATGFRSFLARPDAVEAAPPPLVDPALEGVWVGVEVNDPDVTRTLMIEGNTLDLRAVDGPEWYVVEVVASIPEADPPRFNCVIRDAPADFLKGQSAPVIMKREQIDGREVLTYASLGPGATDYPEDFEPGNGSRVFRFEKPPAPEEANAERLDATQDDRGSSGGFEPSILDPALTGEWLLLAEDREGRLAPQFLEDGAWLGRLVFDGDEWRIYSADDTMFARTRLTLERSGPEDKLQWVDTVLESRGISGAQAWIGESVASDWRKPYRIEDERLYVGDLSFNTQTERFDASPAGEFSRTGYREFFARPAEAQKIIAADALRVEQETGKPAAQRGLRVAASGAEGWRTATLFDWELPSETAGKLLDVETGRITPWSQGGGQRALLASMEREGYDLHVDFNDGDWAHLVSDSWYANATTNTPVSRFPFEITLLTAEGGGMDVAIDSEAAVDAAAGSVTLRYRPVVNRLAVSALESGGRLSESNDRIEFERWSLRDLIQQAHNPMSWKRTRVEELELPLDQRYDGRVVAADPKAALRELLAREFGFELRRVVEPTEALVLRLPADDVHRLTPSDPDRTESGATGHRDYTQFTGMNSQSLAGNLEYRVPGPVVDETGLTGEWDFRLARFEGETLAEAATMIRESFGFEVSIETRPIEFFVIEPSR